MDTEMSAEDFSKLLLETRQMREALLCKVCKDNRSNKLFLPCAHIPACAQCVQALVKCPVCNSNIRGVVTVYRA